MKTYFPWKSVTAIWKNANQLWKDAWYEEVLPPVDDTGQQGGGNLAMGEVWDIWNTNQKKKKRKKIELTCIVGGIYFTKEHESKDEEIVHCKLGQVNVMPSNLVSELKIELKPLL